MVYLNIVYIMYIPNHDTISLSWMDNLCDAMYHRSNPEFLIARKYIENSYTTTFIDYTIENCSYDVRGNFEFKYRPMFGDHIHLGYSMYIDNKYLTMRDHNMTHNVAYEIGPSCSNAPPYAYQKIWYHTGVHTHCDQIIHVHPFSAPRELRVEGRKANLGMWFENVGIFLHGEHFEIPGAGLVRLKMAYYVHVTDPFPAFVTDDPYEIQNLWLVDHQGFVSLYNRDRGRKNTKVLNYKKSINYPKRLSKTYFASFLHQY